jgi:enoyl-CoA hydratase/carnithine racemase
MSYETIILQKKSGIAYLTLNRSDKLNAINQQMLKELLDVFNLLDSDKNTSVVVITGAGRAFSAGVDIHGEFIFQKEKDDKSIFLTPMEVKESLLKQHQLIARVRNLGQITIASVNGICCGGGAFGLALSCDIRIASEKADFWWVGRFGGMIQDFGGTHTLARLVGTAKALELLLTGDHLDGREAERLGIANKVVPHEQLKQTTDAMAEKIAQGAPLALSLLKRMVYSNLEVSLEEALYNEAITQGLALSTEDAKEGVRALREKRIPKFEGK